MKRKTKRATRRKTARTKPILLTVDSILALGVCYDRAQMEQLYLRRGLAYAEAHLRIDGTRPVPEVIECLLEWIGY